MSKSNKSSFKPFVRVTVLSAILASLLIYLGINYHWGNYLKPPPEQSSVLLLPDQNKTNSDDTNVIAAKFPKPDYDPKIIEVDSSNSLIDSMNKAQITEHCVDLLSGEISDESVLELATVNCVMSNFQETFQNTKTEEVLKALKKKRLNFKKQCNREYRHNPNQPQIHTELLIGICVSDRINSSNLRLKQIEFLNLIQHPLDR